MVHSCDFNASFNVHCYIPETGMQTYTVNFNYQNRGYF